MQIDPAKMVAGHRTPKTVLVSCGGVIRTVGCHGYVCGMCHADNILNNDPLTELPAMDQCATCGYINGIPEHQRRFVSLSGSA